MPLIYLQYKINFFSSKMISYTEVQLIQHSALTCDIVGVYVCVKSLWALTNSLLGSFRTSVVLFLFFSNCICRENCDNLTAVGGYRACKVRPTFVPTAGASGTARRFLPLLKEMFDNWWRMDGCLSLCTNCPLCVQTFNIELWGTVQCKADIILNNGNSLGLTKHYRSWTDKYMIYTIYNHKLKLLLYTIYQWPTYK